MSGMRLEPWAKGRPSAGREADAFPSVDNGPSNAICRKLGFTFLEASEFEYPKGHFMRCNDWRLDLFAGSA